MDIGRLLRILGLTSLLGVALCCGAVGADELAGPAEPDGSPILVPEPSEQPQEPAAAQEQSQEPQPESAPEPEPTGPTLSQRLEQYGSAVGVGAGGGQVAIVRLPGRVGPLVYDGAGSLDLAVGDPSSGYTVFPATVRVKVNGRTLLPTDYVVAKLPGRPECVLRFITEVPSGSIVSVEYTYGSDPASRGSVALVGRSLIGAPGAVQPIPLGEGGGRSLPVTLYYGRETWTDGGYQGLMPGSSWHALQSLQGMNRAGRQEYGFSVTDFNLMGASITYGTVRNEAGTSDESYRNRFIRENILGGGQSLSAREGDPSAQAPEGANRDVTWSEFRYGDPASSRLWYAESRFKMDPNYTPVASSQAPAAMSAFLTDPSRWGGRNLMSRWWGASGNPGAWQAFEGAPRGRESLTQFAGWDIRQRAYGLRPSRHLAYSSSTFSQEHLITRQRLQETVESVNLQAPETGTAVQYVENTLAQSRPSNVPQQGATEAALLADPGEDVVTTQKTLSLSQRLARGASAPTLSVTQQQWSQLNRITGIESSTGTVRTTNLSGIAVGQFSMGYTNTRVENEDPTVRGSEAHDVTIGNLPLLGPLRMSGRLHLSQTDQLGVRYTDTTASLQGFRLFSGVNLAGATYQRRRDWNGGSAVQRNIGFTGELLGGTWDAQFSWLAMSSGFLTEQGAAGNPYGYDFSQRTRGVNFRRSLGSWGTELRTGWNETDVNGQSLGQVFYAGATQVLQRRGIGNLVLQGVQYRHLDRFGTLRPSYGWSIRYEYPQRLEAGMRGFEHYGAGDELSFVSRTTWVKANVGEATVGVTWRENPMLNDQPGRQAPFLWRGSSKEYSASMPVTDQLTASASLAQNAVPGGWQIAASDWSSVEFTGPMSAALRPTVWAWNENWSTTYSVSYAFQRGCLSLSRTRTRFNPTGMQLTTWAGSLDWTIADGHTLSLGYRKWRGSAPLAAQSVTESDVGHPLGDAYTLRYSRSWSNGRKLSLVLADAGPLNRYWGQQGAWGSEAAALVGSLPYAEGYPHTRVFLTFETPF